MGDIVYHMIMAAICFFFAVILTWSNERYREILWAGILLWCIGIVLMILIVPAAKDFYTGSPITQLEDNSFAYVVPLETKEDYHLLVVYEEKDKVLFYQLPKDNFKEKLEAGSFVTIKVGDVKDFKPYSVKKQMEVDR